MEKTGTAQYSAGNNGAFDNLIVYSVLRGEEIRAQMIKVRAMSRTGCQVLKPFLPQSSNYH